MEYLVAMATHVPYGTPDEAVKDRRAREAARSRMFAGSTCRMPGSGARMSWGLA